MKIMGIMAISILITVSMAYAGESEEIIYSDSWGEAGISIENQSSSNVVVNFSISSFTFNEIMVDGVNVTSINLPGIFLPNNEGAPDLPGMGRYIALPKHASNPLRGLKILDRSHRYPQ